MYNKYKFVKIWRNKDNSIRAAKTIDKFNPDDFLCPLCKTKEYTIFENDGYPQILYKCTKCKFSVDYDFSGTIPEPPEYIINANKKVLEDAFYGIVETFTPKCPTCGSPDIRDITTTRRMGGLLLGGIASSTLGKTKECRNCNYKW